MAAIMKRGRRNQRPKVDPISNSYVEDRGRRYRICRYNERVIIAALKSLKPGGLERPLDIDGKRARALIKLDETKED